MGALSRREEVKAQFILQTKISKIYQQFFWKLVGVYFCKVYPALFGKQFLDLYKQARKARGCDSSESEIINH